MSEQSYANHRRLVPGFHVVLFAIIVLSLGGAITNLIQSWGDHARLYSASLILALVIAVLILYWFARVFPLKAQDRAIRAEENLRHYVLAGTLPDNRLTIRQIVALRFASDGEFVELARRAAENSLSGDEIKKQIKNWRPDPYRV